jgi:uncharacterized SAM-binding protein YcdF (DUF218 family)
MFTFAKIMQLLILPPGCCLLLMFVGFSVRKDCRTFGRTLVAAGFLMLYLVSIGPVSSALMEPLERPYRPLQEPKKARADAVVVLAGGVRDLSWLKLPPQPSDSSLLRTAEGVRLYRRTRLPLLLVGGSGDPAKQKIVEAEAMARTAEDLGVPQKSIIVINKVRNTLESAAAVKEKMKERAIILVTSASHMTRAMGLFKKKGFQVISAPCGFRAERKERGIFSLLPTVDALLTSNRALAEYISLAWYTITGDL